MQLDCKNLFFGLFINLFANLHTLADRKNLAFSERSNAASDVGTELCGFFRNWHAHLSAGHLMVTLCA
jgi:hypothetical protein